MRRRIRQHLKKYQRKHPILRAKIGDHANNVDVPGREGYVYVRLPNGDVVEVYNDKFSPSLDMDVSIGTDSTDQNVLKVLDLVSGKGRYGDSSTSRQRVQDHAKNHQWMDPDGGNDVVFTELRQFLPYRPTPIGGMSLHVYRNVGWLDGKWQYSSGSTINFSPYIPVTGTAQYALVYINTGSFPDFVINSGSLTTFDLLSLNDIPDPYPGTLPVAAVRLYGGMTGISEDRRQTDLIDLRYPQWHDHLFTTGLRDTPTSYSGEGNKLTSVKADESGLEFISKGDVNKFFDTVTVDSDYYVNDVGTVFVNAGDGDIVITMSTGVIDGQNHYIKRIDASGTTVVLSGTIESAANEFLYAAESLHLVWSSENLSWFVL